MKTFEEFILEASNSDRLRRLASEKQKKDIFGNRPTNVSLDVLKNLERNAAERQNNRYPQQGTVEKPQTIRSRTTPLPRFPITSVFSFNRNPQNPLTPQIRDQRRAEAGASNKGKTTPSGSKLYRSDTSGTSTNNDPVSVIISASKQGRTPKKPPPKPKTKPKSTAKSPSRGGGGGSSTRGLTSGASPSGLTGRFQVGTGTMLAN
jgi:hypothetical protein